MATMDRLEEWFQSRGFFLFLVAAIGLFCVVPYLAFQSLEYTSDGLHLYSSIRNSLKGYGFFYEGPTIGYFLGTHAFLSLLLVFPILKVFDTPLVLAYLTPACHLLGTWLFYRILCFLDAERKARSFIATISVLYFFYPSAFAMMGTYYLFVPDFLLEPLILLAFYAFIRERWWLSGMMGSLIILLKEEYIPLYFLLFLFFIFCSYQKGNSKPNGYWRRLLLGAAMIGLAGTTISLITLKYYRSLNAVGYGVRAPEFAIFTPIARTLQDFWSLIKPVTFILLFAIWRKIGHYQKATFCILVFVLYRVAIDILAYQKIPTYFWGNTMLTPTVYLSLGFFILPGVQHLSLKEKRIFSGVIFASLILCLVDNRHTGTHGLIAKSIRNLGPWNIEKAQELKEIRSKMNTPNGYEYFIGPEYSFTPFMDRSHMSLATLMDDVDIGDKSRRLHLFQKSSYVILPKIPPATPAGSKLPEAREWVKVSHSLVWETANFQLYANLNQRRIGLVN